MQSLSRHKKIILSVLALAFASFPQWLSSVWSLFCSEPFFQWIKEKGIKTPSFSLLWITWPIGLILLGVIAWNSKNRKSKVQIQNPEKIKGEPIIRPDGKIVVDITPAQLVGFFRDHMTNQAEKLVKVYIGKWIIVSGELEDVGTPVKDGYFQVDFKESAVAQGYFLRMYFSKKWFDHLSVMQRGTKINIIGKIAIVESISISLDDCELINS